MRPDAESFGTKELIPLPPIQVKVRRIAFRRRTHLVYCELPGFRSHYYKEPCVARNLTFHVRTGAAGYLLSPKSLSDLGIRK